MNSGKSAPNIGVILKPNASTPMLKRAAIRTSSAINPILRNIE